MPPLRQVERKRRIPAQRLALAFLLVYLLPVAGAVGLHLALTGDPRVLSTAVVCSGAELGTRESWQVRAALVREQGIGPLVEGSRERWFSDRTRSERPEVVRTSEAL